MTYREYQSQIQSRFLEAVSAFNAAYATRFQQGTFVEISVEEDYAKAVKNMSDAANTVQTFNDFLHIRGPVLADDIMTDFP